MNKPTIIRLKLTESIYKVMYFVFLRLFRLIPLLLTLPLLLPILIKKLLDLNESVENFWKDIVNDKKDKININLDIIIAKYKWKNEDLLKQLKSMREDCEYYSNLTPKDNSNISNLLSLLVPIAILIITFQYTFNQQFLYQKSLLQPILDKQYIAIDIRSDLRQLIKGLHNSTMDLDNLRKEDISEIKNSLSQLEQFNIEDASSISTSEDSRKELKVLVLSTQKKVDGLAEYNEISELTEKILNYLNLLDGYNGNDQYQFDVFSELPNYYRQIIIMITVVALFIFILLVREYFGRRVDQSNNYLLNYQIKILDEKIVKLEKIGLKEDENS